MLKTVPEELQTSAERDADAALTAFDAEVAEHRATLVQAQEASRDAANAIRDGLLYGRGHDLEVAVTRALSKAGIDVEQLDVALGETASADLLCTFGGRSALVEVKSVGGNASESLYAALVKHIDAWHANPKRVAIDGGVLVINHEHKKEPADRSPRPYTRQAFLDSQRYPVVATAGLFDAWRNGDWARIRALMFGDNFPEAQPMPMQSAPPTGAHTTDEQDRRRKWWSRGRR